MAVETRLLSLIKQQIGGANNGEILITRDTLLADTGLDSLGFATIVVAMEREYNVDPFVQADGIIYPETFGQLVDIYKADLHDRTGS